MFTAFKINTAFFICLAFVFRLLFVNINLLSSFQTSPTAKLSAKHSSTIKKRRRPVEVAAQSGFNKDYAVVEVCEENADGEEDFSKANTPVILSVLFSYFKHLLFIPKSAQPFDSIKCDLYPKKYLSLSILRI
jgi:hypothetical protein